MNPQKKADKLFFMIEKCPNIMAPDISPQKVCSAKGIPSEEISYPSFGTEQTLESEGQNEISIF